MNKKIGEGSQGFAYLSTDTETKEKVVVKLFKESPLVKATFKREIAPAECHANHPNVLKLFGAGYAASKNSDGEQIAEHYYTVSEYAPKGELFCFVDRTKGFEAPVARTLFKQALAGVQCIHAKNIAHRDIKPENFFLDEKC